MNISKLKV